MIARPDDVPLENFVIPPKLREMVRSIVLGVHVRATGAEYELHDTLTDRVLASYDGLMEAQDAKAEMICELVAEVMVGSLIEATRARLDSIERRSADRTEATAKLMMAQALGRG